MSLEGAAERRATPAELERIVRFFPSEHRECAGGQLCYDAWSRQ